MIELCNLKEDAILVTGASGLIGSNLVREISSQRHSHAPKIVVVTKSGYMPSIGIDGDKVEILKGDLLDPQFIDCLGKFDVIFHGAGYGQPARFLEDTFGTLALNSEVTAKLLKRVLPGGRFIFFSSSEIYSGSTEIPSLEEHIGSTDPFHPRAAYIEGKRVGEAMTYLARSAFGISATSIRIALVFGPGTKQGDARVMNSFIARAVKDKRLEMLDMGEALRTYCYVDDAVRIILRIANVGGDVVYNLGGIETISIRQLGEMICAITGADFVLPKKDRGLESAPNIVKLDMAKTLKLFPDNFEYEKIYEGLQSTIEWQRKILLDT
jgi:nucleoside-diphosphate-sugar epimerase